MLEHLESCVYSLKGNYGLDDSPYDPLRLLDGIYHPTPNTQHQPYKRNEGGGKNKKMISIYCSFFLLFSIPKQTCSSHLRVPTPRSSSTSTFLLSFLGCCRPLEVPDLFYQIVFLITELLILRTVCLKVAQELHQFGLVLQQYVHHRLSLAGVRDKHLVIEET